MGVNGALACLALIGGIGNRSLVWHGKLNVLLNTVR